MFRILYKGEVIKDNLTEQQLIQELFELSIAVTDEKIDKAELNVEEF
jgi:hypothetical protein